MLLFIHLRNSEFCTRDEGSEYDSPQAALALGVQSAMGMTADEVGRGSRTAAVVVNVEREDGTRLLSSVVGASVSPLLVTEAE